jgi:hypothetical protein
MAFGMFPYGNLGHAELASLVALLVSAAALWTCLRSFEQARRSAAAAAGDLPPNLALHPAPLALAESPIDDLILRVDNHNRRPIRLTEVCLREPARMGLVAYLPDGPRELLLGGIDRKHDTIPLNLMVPGTAPGAASASSVSLRLVLTGGAPAAKGRKGSLRAAVRVTFEMLQPVPETRTEVVVLDIARRGRVSARPALVPDTATAR